MVGGALGISVGRTVCSQPLKAQTAGAKEVELGWGAAWSGGGASLPGPRAGPLMTLPGGPKPPSLHRRTPRLHVNYLPRDTQPRGRFRNLLGCVELQRSFQDYQIDRASYNLDHPEERSKHRRGENSWGHRAERVPTILTVLSWKTVPKVSGAHPWNLSFFLTRKKNLGRDEDLEMGALSWIACVGSKSSHKCPHKGGAEIADTEEKAMRRERTDWTDGPRQRMPEQADAGRGKGRSLPRASGVSGVLPTSAFCPRRWMLNIWPPDAKRIHFCKSASFWQ